MLTAPADFRGVFRSDIDARAVYSEAAGIAQMLPAAVAVPVDADDVSALVRWAAATKTPIIPRGSGSGMAGGAVGPGVVADLGRLGHIGTVDVHARRIRTGAGALRDGVDVAALRQGLRFPVDPSSGAYCTIGGMAATNAAGAHSLKYGPMRTWVVGLDCVFADGSRATVRRGSPLPEGIPALQRIADLIARAGRGALLAAGRAAGVSKDSSGFALAEVSRGDIVDLLVGSEGTLALFVGAELALKPVPAATSSLLAAFPTLESCVEAALLARDLDASACELLDRTFLEIAEKGGSPLPVRPGTEAVLLAEVEGKSAAHAADQARYIERAFRGAGAKEITVALHAETEQRLWDLRHRASPALALMHPDRRSMQFIEDGAVPMRQLPAYVRGVRAALERQGMSAAIFGHAGDAHVHVNPLVDVNDPNWRVKVEALLEEVAELTRRVGGTMTGEHGDGRLRTPLLSRFHGEATMSLYAQVKDAFDPDGILNPGVKIPLPGQRPLEAIKYDPLLPPLPAAARAALDHVASERAYASARLALLDR